MTDFTSIPDWHRALILFIFTVLIIVQIYIIAASYPKEKIRIKTITIFLISFPILSFFNKIQYDIAKNIGGGWETSIISIVPYEFIDIAVAALAAYEMIILHRLSVRRKTSIGPDSIKESIDELPTALCFGEEDGSPILVNRRMYKLCFDMTGNDLTNVNEFWNNMDLRFASRDTDEADSNTYRSSCSDNEGKMWTFAKRIIRVESRNITEITAADTTEEYMLTGKIRDDNKILKEINEKLRKYSEDVEETARQREILDEKIEIHDFMGRALTQTKYYISQNRFMSKNEIVSLWRKNIELLKGETLEKEDTNPQNDLDNAAEAVGVHIQWDGNFPEEDSTASELVILAGRECLMNAIQHAEADILRIKIVEDTTDYVIEYTNNGKKPNGMFREGGGLSRLREHIEMAGGSMVICSKDGFRLKLNIPKGVYKND
jgi:hypothetical protein